MTREQVIHDLQTLADAFCERDGAEPMCLREAVRYISAAQPTGNAIRLIDADALKKAIHSYENRQIPLDTVIDNAPTVEYTFEEAFQKTVCEQRLYCPERRQGKWKYSDKWTTGRCSVCGEFNDFPSNYCPHCGTRMEDPA